MQWIWHYIFEIDFIQIFVSKCKFLICRRFSAFLSSVDSVIGCLLPLSSYLSTWFCILNAYDIKGKISFLCFSRNAVGVFNFLATEFLQIFICACYFLVTSVIGDQDCGKIRARGTWIFHFILCPRVRDRRSAVWHLKEMYSRQICSKLRKNKHHRWI